MIAVVNQPCGLGDILFTQKIAHELINNHSAEKIIWPVIEPFEYISEYINTSLPVEFVPMSEKIFPSSSQRLPMRWRQGDKDVYYLPIRYANERYRLPAGHPDFMECKYTSMNITSENWQEYVHITRNKEREQVLKDTLGVKGEYIIVNRNFGSPPDSKKINIPLENIGNVSVVEMDYLGFDNIFDWIPLFEEAEAVYTVETSVTYILSILGIQNVHVYPRTGFKKLRICERNPFSRMDIL